MVRFKRLPIFIFAILMACKLAADCAEVTALRILKEHKITVVTNCAEEDLARAFFSWNFTPEQVITPYHLILERDNLKTGGDLLFIIDRSKPLTDTEEQLLPVPPGAIGADEVLTLVVKKSIGLKKTYKNAWQILISAPNFTWLEKELKLIPEVLNSPLHRRGDEAKRLHHYRVEMLQIVTSLPEEQLTKWADAQLDTKSRALDYVFTPLSLWDGNSLPGRGLMLVLDGMKWEANSEKIHAALPDALKGWADSGARKTEGMALRSRLKVGSDTVPFYVVSAPNERLVYKILKKYPSSEDIPSQPDKVVFSNLSDFGRLTLMVRLSDKLENSIALISDFSNKFLAALKASGAGFETSSYHDTRERQIDLLFEGDSAESTLSDIPDDLPEGARGLIVLSLASLGTQTSYISASPRQITEPYPAYPVKKPDEPSKPSLSERKYGIFGPKVFNGSDDPRYRRALLEYEEKKRRYQTDIVYWEANRDAYEQQRNTHSMQWQVTIDRLETVQAAANVAIYDTRQSAGAAGKVVYTSVVNTDKNERSYHKDTLVTVVGERSRPGAIDLPAAENRIYNDTLISGALESAAKVAVQQILDSCILPADQK